jgi:general secretion pathway protein G
MERKKRRRVQGFTLVELMVVIVIIGILAGVVVVNYTGRTEKAIEARTKADFKSIQDAIDLFKSDTGEYPEKLEDLMQNPGFDRWSGPYLRRDPLDYWDRIYVYEMLGEGTYPYELKTYGADGNPGGEGESKDYSNLDSVTDMQ